VRSCGVTFASRAQVRGDNKRFDNTRKPKLLNPQPSTLNSQPSTLNPQPQTQVRGDNKRFASESRKHPIVDAGSPIATADRTGREVIITDTRHLQRGSLPREFGIKAVHLVPVRDGVLEVPQKSPDICRKRSLIYAAKEPRYMPQKSPDICRKEPRCMPQKSPDICRKRSLIYAAKEPRYMPQNSPDRALLRALRAPTSVLVGA